MTHEQKMQLITVAAAARKNARVVKSGFHVGAALITRDGTIIDGCNVEMDNILMSICAERCAVCKAVSMGYVDFEAIAVVSDSAKPVAPCGICRQFLIDFGRDITVIMANATGDCVVESSAETLMPMAFTSSSKILDGEIY